MISHGLKSPRKNCAFRVLPKALRQTMPQQKIASTSILPLDTERNLFFTKTDTRMQYLAMNVRHNLGFHQSRDDCTARGKAQLRLIILSSWHPCRVHVIFIHISRRNKPKECAISSQFTAQSYMITATLALKSRARHCSKHGFIAFQDLYRYQRMV